MYCLCNCRIMDTQTQLKAEPDESLNLKMHFLRMHYEKASNLKSKANDFECENCLVSE